MAKLKDLQDDKYVINFVDICSQLDPSATNKYVPYMLSLLETYIAEVRRDYVEKNLNDIKDLINNFHDLSERDQLENKDIYAYESYEALEKAIQEGKTKITESQVKKRETKVLYDDENLLVIRPLSFKSSRLYGATTTWCTASDKQEYAEYFEKYAKGVLVYFINKTKDPLKDKHAKIAFHNATDFKDDNDVTIWDVEDKQITSGDMFSLVGKSIPLNVYQIIHNELYSGIQIEIIKH